MKLTIFNGSPKSGINNTEALLKYFINGFTSQGGNQVEVHKLNKFNSVQEAVAIFECSDNILLAFPLYTFAMPGGVKEFIEALQPLAGKCQTKKIGFLVQYGFHEAVHARPLEKYLIKLSKILGCQYIGTIIKGGCDSFASGKGLQYKQIAAGIQQIGETLGKQGVFDPNEIDHYSQPELEKNHLVIIMKLVVKLVNKYYWGGMMKKNGVSIEEGYARPYTES